MSKSSPSTVTTVNPVSQAQLPFLTSGWQQAQGLAGLAGYPAAGMSYLSQLADTAQADTNNFLAPQYGGYNVMPFASIAENAMLTGQGTPYYAASPQAGYLSGLAPNAVQNAFNMQDLMTNVSGAAPGAVAPWQSALSGVGNSAMSLPGTGYGYSSEMQGLGGEAMGAIGGYAPGAASVANPQIAGLNTNAAGAVSGNPFMSGLQGLASGQYINPNTNPALGNVISAATTPITNAFMTATAPMISSSAEQAGRYGSGVMGNQQNIAGYNLGQALQNTVGNIVNNAYNTGLSTTLSAGNAGAGAYNTGVANTTGALTAAGGLGQTGVNNAANITNQGFTTGGNLIQGGALDLNNLAGTGYGAANTAYGAGGNLGLSGISTQLSGLGNAGQIGNSGYQIGGAIANNAGQLNNSGQLTLGNLVQNAPQFADFPLSQMSAAYNSIWQPLQNYSAILGGPTGGSQSVTSPNQQNILQSVGSGLGGIASFANLFGGSGPLAGLFGSDRRFKTDIKRIGTADNGLPLYWFRYAGTNNYAIGVMADEVERIRPDAVLRDADGYQYVDYPKALQR